MNNFMSDRPGFYEEMSNSNENEPGPSSTTIPPIEKEHMFDKVVTPSDVGKLNRLVIPKQHAERYFPLDSSTNEKGLLLNFEDRNGKPWRFRYSYWNSSQSYVMTKGWSRFVKEKKLDAGDIVSFQRGVGDKDRLFIDWRRRPDAPDLLPPSLPNHFSPFQYPNNITRFNTNNATPWNPLFVNASPRDQYGSYYSHLAQQQQLQYQNQNQNQNQSHYGFNYGYNSSNAATTTVVNGNPCPPGSIFYLSRPGNGNGTGGNGGGGGEFIVAGRHQEGVVQNEHMVYESVPVVQGKAAAKKLRLFGVNMECPIQESDECDQMLSTSTNTNNNTVPLHQYFPASSTSNTSPTTSSSSFPNSLQFMRTNYGDEDDDKGKGSMSLDLDI